MANGPAYAKAQWLERQDDDIEKWTLENTVAEKNGCFLLFPNLLTWRTLKEYKYYT